MNRQTEVDCPDLSYDHHCHLFICLQLSHPEISWRSKRDSDGTSYESWFLAGMNLPTGIVYYYLPLWMYAMLDDSKVTTLEKAPKTYCMTSNDILVKIFDWMVSMKR